MWDGPFRLRAQRVQALRRDLAGALAEAGRPLIPRWGRAFRPVQASLPSSPLAIVTSEERRRLEIPESEAPREAWILRPASDIDALRGIELMLLNECNAQSGQGLSTPAGRRAASMRAERHSDWHAEVAPQAIEDGIHGFDSECPGCDFGLPRQPENAPALVRVTTQ
jgi:hypothetical protein